MLRLWISIYCELVIYKKMAGAGRNRTHRSRISRLPDGFEDRAGHQSRFTPVARSVALEQSRMVLCAEQNAAESFAAEEGGETEKIAGCDQWPLH